MKTFVTLDNINLLVKYTTLVLKLELLGFEYTFSKFYTLSILKLMYCLELSVQVLVKFNNHCHVRPIYINVQRYFNSVIKYHFLLYKIISSTYQTFSSMCKVHS